jgi:hypothetical protein
MVFLRFIRQMSSWQTAFLPSQMSPTEPDFAPLPVSRLPSRGGPWSTANHTTLARGGRDGCWVWSRNSS